ncbi:MAG: site-2 protease family protein [Chloroflexi bacterium]|nr:site-2 protease family protein [Chloroflexota bacterium]
MEATLKLGRIFGVPVGLHWSWFIIFSLVTVSLSAGYFSEFIPSDHQTALWLFGTFTSLLFFLSILAHEFGHAIVAKRRNLEVQSITLFAFGGVAQIGEEPRSPIEEFVVAGAGPLVTLLATLIFFVVWKATPGFPAFSAASSWLARINLALFLFNLIPGFPLDGGRIFRSFLWRLVKNYYRATRITSYFGQGIAFALIALGIYAGFRGAIVNGIWFIFIGWFLQNSASSYSSETSLRQTLEHVKVGDVMKRDLHPIQASLSLTQLASDPVYTLGDRIFTVVKNDRFCGLLSLGDTNAYHYLDWEHTRVEQIMTPVERLVEIHPDMSLLAAMSMIDRLNQSEIPVVQDGEIIGLLSRERILQNLKLRSDPGAQTHPVSS